MAALPYMKLYWGDYLADTGHLTAVEHGGYLLLIAHYWRTGSLPDSDAKLARIARMSTKEWKRHGSTILDFFPNGKHKRIEQERDDARLKTEKNKLSAEKRWNASEEPKSLISFDVSDANALPTHCEGNDSHSHSHSYIQKDKKKEKNTKKETPLAPLAEFEKFWSVYPRRVGRGAAMKALKTALRKATIEEIVAGVQRYKFSDDTQFIPHPGTWLNQERWSDEEATERSAIRTVQQIVADEAAFLENERRELLKEIDQFHEYGWPMDKKSVERAIEIGIEVSAEVRASAVYMPSTNWE